jgi:hypothetical protein
MRAEQFLPDCPESTLRISSEFSVFITEPFMTCVTELGIERRPAETTWLSVITRQSLLPLASHH